MTVTPKLTVVRTLTVAGLLGSVWTILVAETSLRSGMAFTTWFITSGIICLAAAVGAARRPRQSVALTMACLLTLAHAVLWLWILRIALGERSIL